MVVFLALQGGPHEHQIGALAALLLEVNSACEHLGSGGTDTHTRFCWIFFLTD